MYSYMIYFGLKVLSNMGTLVPKYSMYLIYGYLDLLGDKQYGF